MQRFIIEDLSDKMGDQVAAAVNTFKELAEIPSVSSAEIVRSSDGERKCELTSLAAIKQST